MSEAPHQRKTRAKTLERAAKVAKYDEQNLRDPEIATLMKVSVRTVGNLRRAWRDSKRDSAHGHEETPEPGEVLYAAWCQAKMNRPPGDSPEEWADEFKAFFDEFANRRGGLRPHNEEWVRRAFESDRVLLNCPPRHAKSTVFSVFLPLWLVSRDRNVNIIIASASESMSKKWLREIADHMTQDENLIRAFGRFKPEADEAAWRPKSGQLTVVGRDTLSHTGDFTIESRGKGQQFLGKGADWIIVDDAAEVSDSFSDLSRSRISDWFHGDVMSRMESEEGNEDSLGHVIVIGQRLHMWDLYGQLASEKDDETGKPLWTHLNYQAVLDWDEKLVLWPEKFPWKLIQRLRQEQGPRIFETMYQQNPLPEGAALLQRAWVYGDDEHEGCLDMDRFGLMAPEYGPTDLYTRVIALDPSQGSRAKAGFIVADVMKDNVFRCNVLQIMHENMDVKAMLENIHMAMDIFTPSVLIFEQNTAQRWFLQYSEFMPIRAAMRVIGHNTGRNKADPQLGVQGLSQDFELGNIRFPYGDAHGREMSTLLINEGLQYPQGLTDDTLMALWFIKYNRNSLYLPSWYAQQGGPRWDTPQRLEGGWKF